MAKKYRHQAPPTNEEKMRQAMLSKDNRITELEKELNAAKTAIQLISGSEGLKHFKDYIRSQEQAIIWLEGSTQHYYTLDRLATVTATIGTNSIVAEGTKVK